MYKKILVPVDGSHTATLGLQEAIRIAATQHSKLRLISVVDEFVIASNIEGFMNAGELFDMLRESGKKAIKNGVALAQKHGIKAESAIFETMGERVSDIIVREAKKWRADVIVMGTHGHRGFSRMVLGSDAEAVLRTSPVPVIMVRSPDGKKPAKSSGSKSSAARLQR